MQKSLFNAQECLLIGLDLQEKLLPAMYSKEKVLHSAKILLETAKLFKLKTIITEQYPKGLGNTDKSLCFKEIKSFDDFDFNEESVAQALRFEKIAFGIFNDEKIAQEIKNTQLSKLIFFGIETHVCILQSVLRALELGYEVWLIKEALSSRTEENHQNGLDLMKQMGAKIINLESFLFGLMKDAKEPNFKQISALIK